VILRRLAAIALLASTALAGCASDDPVDVRAALLRVTIDSCAPGTEDRATAVSIGDGLALTVAHSFDDADAVSLVESDGNEVTADLVYLDRTRDIALLAYETVDVNPDAQRGLSVHSDAESPADEARVVVFRSGAAVVRPVDLLQRTAITLDGEGRRDSIKLGAEIEAGDSGAPIIDTEGRIIGMVFATSRTGDTGWAIAGGELVAVEDRAGAPIPLRC
jgi:S1-C subfamily serine protease